jgi:hypothetical protein
MLKRLMLLSLGFALCLGMMGCGGSEPVEVPDTGEPPPETTPAAQADVEAPSPG